MATQLLMRTRAKWERRDWELFTNIRDHGVTHQRVVILIERGNTKEMFTGTNTLRDRLTEQDTLSVQDKVGLFYHMTLNNFQIM